MTDDLDADTVPNLLLARYRVEGLLGEGGLGTVVKAFDTRLKRTVAIKTLKRSSYTVDPSLFRAFEERFAREAEAGSRMGSHPNLVTVYDLVTDAERTQYLILEYVSGGTLADRLRQGALPLPDALRLTADIARGLQSAHTTGIIHRDIKPANIFLSDEGRAQVGDFGIAQIDDISGRTQSTTGHPGTPLYMSPEQAHSTGYVRASSDQYSLGLVLFEMLTGTAYKRLEKHETDKVLAAQPPPVRTLIARMLALEPGDRYPGMSGVLAATQAIASMPAQTPPDNAPTLIAPQHAEMITNRETPAINLQPVPPLVQGPPRPSAISRRAVVAGIGGLVLAGGAAGGVFLSSQRGGSIATPQGNNATITTAPPSATIAGNQVSATTATPAGTTPIPVSITPTSAGTTITPGSVVASATPFPATAPASPSVPAVARRNTSLLAYLDGRVALPEENQDSARNIIVGDPVQVMGVDLSRNEPAKLPAVTAPNGSRVIRTLWAPKGTLLATLVRQPVPGGFSTSVDLSVIDIATGKAYNTAKAINSLPAWAPDGETLVYTLIAGKKPATLPGTTNVQSVDSYDVHLVRYDGRNDRVIANLVPPPTALGGYATPDPIEALVRASSFFSTLGDTIWAADNSRISVYIKFRRFTLRPDGTDIKQQDGNLDNSFGPTTNDAYLPSTGLQLALADDNDALQWRYEQGFIPSAIVSGCPRADEVGKACNNTRKTSPNAGYRNQIIGLFPDGTEKRITNSPTFKYHIAVSPDGSSVAFTGITVLDYEAAKADIEKYPGAYFVGYKTDVYVARVADGSEVNVSKTGTAHHPSWERDAPLKAIPGATVAWTNSERTIHLAYPQDWRATRDQTDQNNILELDSPDGVFFYLSKYPQSRSTTSYSALEGINGYRDRQLKRTDRSYEQGPIGESHVNGGQAAFMEFKSVSKSDPSDSRTGVVWYIDGNATQFVIEAFAKGATFRRHNEVSAIIDTVSLVIV